MLATLSVGLASGVELYGFALFATAFVLAVHSLTGFRLLRFEF